MEEKKKIQLEANASATCKVKSSNDFEWLISIRADNFVDLLEKLKVAEQTFGIDGYTPLANTYGNKTSAPKPQNLGNCEKCGAPNAMSKAGKPYCSARCWLASQPKSY